MPELVHRHALASRHRGDEGGRLRSLDGLQPRDVVIDVSRDAARTRTGQRVALHLANLLGRIEGVVGNVSAVLEDAQAPLERGTDPRAPRGGASLAEAISRSGALVSERPPDATTPLVVRVGSGGAADVYASASAWGAYVGRSPAPPCADDPDGAVGPHVSAALAASEVFRLIRGVGEHSRPTEAMTFDAWSARVVASFAEVDRPDLGGLEVPPFVLAGVGAVGSAFLLTLWSSGLSVPDGLLVDRDRVSLTNLNRYVLFGLQDLGRWKCTAAAALLKRRGNAPFTVRGTRRWWAEHYACHKACPPLLVSAVDTNRARHELQNTLPSCVLGASTRGLRAQVDRYDLRDDESRCMKCFNPPESAESDDAVVQRLSGLSFGEIGEESRRSGIPERRLRSYLAEKASGRTGCAVLDGADLDRLRLAAGERQFAVSFVSSLAGSLLAAQLVRQAAGVPLLVGASSRLNFQLWCPGSPANGIRTAPPEAGCWCSTGARDVHREVWPGP